MTDANLRKPVARLSSGFLTTALKTFVAAISGVAVEASALSQRPNPPTGAPAVAAARYGDWTVVVASDSSEAGTHDDAGDAFGFACSRSCVHYIDLQRECGDGSDYAGTATVGEKVFPLTLTCHARGQHVFVVAMTGEYLTALANGNTVTVRVTFADRDSKTADFSLNGCSEAAAAAAQIAFLFGEDQEGLAMKVRR